MHALSMYPFLKAASCNPSQIRVSEDTDAYSITLSLCLPCNHRQRKTYKERKAQNKPVCKTNTESMTERTDITENVFS